MRVFLGAVLLLSAQAASAQPAATPRAAILRALPILQQSARTFVDKRGCVSCHHNILPILTLHRARERGLRIDPATLTAVEAKTFRELTAPAAADNALQGINVADPTPNDSYLLMAAQAAGRPRDLTMEIYARRIARWQRADHWVTSDFRPPHSSSDFTATATAIRAVRAYMPDELAGERDAATRRARAWLVSTTPHSTEDAAFRLLGLVWAEASAEEVTTARRDLLARQLSNGGWPQLAGYAADAYSTGEALVALHDAGMSTTDRTWERGAAFLLSTQARDGTWRVRTRMLSPADISPPYFSTGFPYGKDAFLSYAGTSWAVMALLDALPHASSPPPTAAAVVAEEREPAWLRPAIFGTAKDLAVRLDAGLDANSATSNGTTLLMAAATDAEKVALLLQHGARPQTRATSGVDAVTVASTYRGTASSMRLLLDAGGAAAPPDSVHVRHHPLVYAAMSGDLDVAALLLARGAKASAEALAESITFNNIEVTRALLAAGATADGKESTGVTLLHWAVIANRPAAIPLLVAAGVDPNAKDNAGFTALMYAATVDLGGTQLVSALLAAGADRTVHNAAGRTPLQQARFLGHADLARALR